jgi:hypothetical protein
MKRENEIIQLAPAQQRAFDMLLQAIAAGNLTLLKGRACSGRTTILTKLQASAGGVLLGMRQFMVRLAAKPPYALEEAFLQMIEQGLGAYDLVMVDDLHLITQVTQNCDYPRAYLLDAALTAIIGEAASLKKQLVFASNGDAPWPIARRAFAVEIADFDPENTARSATD